MAWCPDHAVLLALWVTIAGLPAFALFGGLGWLAWRHDRRWASVVALLLACVVCAIATITVRGEPTLAVIPALMIVLAAVHGYAAWKPAPPARVVGLAASMLPLLAIVLAMLLEARATQSCHLI